MNTYSLEAYEHMRDAPIAATLREEVYQFIKHHGPVTDETIQQRLNMNPSTQRPRRGELVTRGLIIASPDSGYTSSGRRATLWVTPPDVSK